MPGRTYEHAVVIREVHCRGCGYDLRGLVAGGQCSECGLDVHDTLVHILDPASSRLPKLRNPAQVGNGLLWVMVCIMLGLVAWMAIPSAGALDGVLKTSWARSLPPSTRTVAGVLVLLGLWAVWAFRAPRAKETRPEVRASVRQVAAGLLICGLVGVTYDLWNGTLFDDDLEQMVANLALAAGGICTYSGLRSVLQTIGRRSRTFRTSIGGRQRMREMNAAIYGFAVASLGHGLIAASLGDRLSTSDVWTTIVALLSLIQGLCLLMLVIGQAYLVVNAAWIRRSLRTPPPVLKDILGDDLREDASPAEPPAGEVPPDGPLY